MDEDERNPHGVGASKAALNRMVEKQDFVEQMDKKASKLENQNCFKYINILHGQIKEVIGQLVTNYKLNSDQNALMSQNEIIS